ncbi:MAG: cytochrome P450 [Dehalococcoidia bacterium]
MTQAAEPVLFNPLDPSFRIDPYSVYARLRAEDPVHESPFGALVFSRYADCVAILRDPLSSSDQRNAEVYQQAVADGAIEVDERVIDAEPFLFLDPPDHTRLRGLVSKAFTPRVIERLRPRIEVWVDELLDAVAKKGSLEVIEDIAYPLPVNVICEMLGVPSEDHVRFRDWSREAARSLDPVELLPPEALEARTRTIESFRDYFSELIEKRRTNPRDDLLSALIAAEEAGDKLNKEELLATCILLLVAGHETTVNLIGNGMLALLRNPDQLDLLRSEPALAQSAVEEILRYDPPVQMTVRSALEDMDVRGLTLPKGTQSVILLASGNRDEAEFPNAERFDIRRADNHHLAFGFGIHYCLGAPLARVEGEIALRSLVQRFENLQLQTEAPEYKENIVLRGLASLPVAFSGVS